MNCLKIDHQDSVLYAQMFRTQCLNRTKCIYMHLYVWYIAAFHYVDYSILRFTYYFERWANYIWINRKIQFTIYSNLHIAERQLLFINIEIITYNFYHLYLSFISIPHFKLREISDHVSKNSLPRYVYDSLILRINQSHRNNY